MLPEAARINRCLIWSLINPTCCPFANDVLCLITGHGMCYAHCMAYDLGSPLQEFTFSCSHQTQ